jgi:hypothetical protein
MCCLPGAAVSAGNRRGMIETTFGVRKRDEGDRLKGDRVEIVIDTGEGSRTYEVTATRAGRRVDITNRRGVVEVSEVTRTGTPVRTARFMASRVVAIVEHPADESAR